jgi:Asp-tRNA(Asn)/Glu-tRNA(Gln) amidotransferase A subunit family amidase
MRQTGCPFFTSLLIGLASVTLLSGCSFVRGWSSNGPKNRAFIAYWPPPEGSTQLKVAIKDNIDMEGVVTTAGSEYLLKHNPPAKKDAACLAILRQRPVHIVGKTNLSEFAVSPSGTNDYFGTPSNPFNKLWKLIPGGSSCGSAVAVANGQADVALGTDTAGSVRVPAACCGIVGLKTTHGLLSLDGVFPIEPEHLDTVGPMARDIAHTVIGMDLLQSGFAQRYASVAAAKPTGKGIRVARLRLKNTYPRIDDAVDEALAKAGFQVVRLGDDFRKKWEQAALDGDNVAATGAWLNDGKYRFKLGVTNRAKSVIGVGQLSYQTSYRAALARRADWQRTLQNVFKRADFIAVPTMKSTPSAIPPNFGYGVIEAVMLKLQNTVAVNLAGNPALAMPVPMRGAMVPVASLQLIGPPRSEAELLNAGRIVEAAFRKD